MDEVRTYGLPRSVPHIKPEQRHAMPQSLRETVGNLSRVMVYLWLKNGQSFWYYVLYRDVATLRGYIASKQGWRRADIPLCQIWSYY